MTARVVVPFDDSDQSWLALTYAFEQFPDADVTVLHAVQPFPDHTKAGGYPGRRHARVFAERQALLDDATAAVADRPDTVQTELLYGRPRSEIPRYVAKHGFDEVVMGSRGLTGAATRFLGSVSRAVIRQTPVPVTVLRTTPMSDGGSTQSLCPRRVLVPFDGSARSRDALVYAFERFPDADVTAMLVLTTGARPPRAVASGVDHDDDDVTARADAGDSWDRTQALTAAELLAERHGRPLLTAVEQGDLVSCLAGRTRSDDVDHVVAGRSRTSRLRDVLQGSPVESLVGHASVPVTVVP
jgi:nucleotide-binding universal stress UspA family protein